MEGGCLMANPYTPTELSEGIFHNCNALIFPRCLPFPMMDLAFKFLAVDDSLPDITNYTWHSTLHVVVLSFSSFRHPTIWTSLWIPIGAAGENGGCTIIWKRALHLMRNDLKISFSACFVYQYFRANWSVSDNSPILNNQHQTRRPMNIINFWMSLYS